MLNEIHSGDLTDPCGKRVLLKREGKFIPEITTATYRGLLAGEAMSWLHEEHAFMTWHATDAILYGHARVMNDLEKEGKALTDAVVLGLPEIKAEVEAVVKQYISRFGQRMSSVQLLGTEVPIRMSFSHGSLTSGPVELASHLDLLIRDHQGVFTTPGSLICIDFKYRIQSPTIAYLSRNKQFIMYCLMIHGGRCLFGGEWIELAEWPQLCWFDLPSLKPYGRAVSTKNDAGEIQEYKRGDPRPERSIMRFVNFQPGKIEGMRDTIAEAIRGYAHGVFITAPDPIGCQVCPCQDWCEQFA